MARLSLASYTLVAIGVLLVVASLLFDLDAFVLLGGVLLTLAGLVKVAVVLIWTRVAGMGTDRHRPIRDM